VLTWDRVQRLTLSHRLLTIQPVEWTDLGGADPVERERWAKRAKKRPSRPAVQYTLAKGLPARAQLREIVAQLSAGQVNLH